MSACKTCGSDLAAGIRFCPACGAPSVIPEAPAGPASAAAAETSVPAEPLATNVAGALSYLVGFITGIIFIVIDPYKNNSFIRFHAFQSIFFNLAWFAFWIVWMILTAILTPITAGVFGLIALPIDIIISLLAFVVWLFLMYQAYQQKLYKLPIVGKFAAQQAGVKL